MASSIFGPTSGNDWMENSIQQAQKLMGSINMMSNPQQMLQQLVSQNPQYSYLMNLVNQNNGDIRSTVVNLAKQKGVDLDALYKRFNSR